MARVFLIQPPLTPGELYSRGSKESASLLPPLGLAYIASYLRKHGHVCSILDGLAECVSFEEICRQARDYDVIGITVVSTIALVAIKLIQALKENGIKAPVVVGGPHITALPEALLGWGADYAVVGEGEETMLELVEALERSGGSVSEVNGLVFRQNGQYVRTGRRALIDPLDKIPIPARDLLPMHLYRTSPARSKLQPSHSVLLSRGCPGTCSFCSKKTFGINCRYFSVERIVEEFFVLRDRYGAKDIAVLDDNFAANNYIVMQTCEELIRRRFDLSWSVEARIDGVSRKVLEMLKRAGCTYICYGIESGSERLLCHMRKQISKNQIRRTIRMTKEVGIPIRGYFMMGLPTETVKEMEDTIKFAIELDVDVASFSLFIPFPGTVEYSRALKSGTFSDPEYFHHLIVPEFNFLDNPIYVPEGMTAGNLLSIHRKAYNRFYFRPRILWRYLHSIRSKDELFNLVNGGLTLFKNAVSKV